MNARIGGRADRRAPGVVAAVLLLLSGCVGPVAQPRQAAGIDVRIIAFNDFHGNIEAPGRTVEAPGAGDATIKVPAGGAAYLAAAIERLRAGSPNTAVVSAGDMIGASPLASAIFLDEPTIAAMNLMRVDFNAVGNHEFDRGRAELLRMQKGGCEKNTVLDPCRLEPFAGADFAFLAANTITESGTPLLAPYGIKEFASGRARVRIGFIGMTLKETPTLTSPAGVAGLSFRDEAETANALIPRLKAEGADAIVILIHQGATTTGGYNDKSCAGLDGALLPILDRLDPAVDLVVSGHTHRAYVCDYGQVNPARPFLVTSAGQYGTLLTDIRLTIDPATGKVTAKNADNVIVQGANYGGKTAPAEQYPRFPADPRVAALVERYAAAAAPLARRVVGRLSGPALRAAAPSGEQALGSIIADAQLAASRGRDRGGAQIAFMNPGGVRADIVPGPDGSVTFGQLFAAQPFGNSLVVKSFTGRQIRGLLEQQFNSGSNSVEAPMILQVSSGFTYAYDLTRPAGQRIIDARLDGALLQDDAVYRVAMNNFLANGGDNFSMFTQGTAALGGGQDIEALEAYVAASNPLALPAPGRIRRLSQ